MRTASGILIFCLIGTLKTVAAAVPEEDRIRGLTCWDYAVPPSQAGAVDAPPEPAEAETDAAALPDDALELTTGTADIKSNGDAEFDGPIQFRNKQLRLRADSAVYSKSDDQFEAEGNILYTDAGSEISGSAARYSARTGHFSFEDAQFHMQKTKARGTAEKIGLERKGVLELEKVSFTSCPPGNNDWELRANRIILNTESALGTARGATLRFKGVPFLYLPYLTYPIANERKSGMLFPTFGNSDRRGFEYYQPIYWNIAPSYDATFIPRYMSDRGLQLGSEFRYLTKTDNVVLWADYLGDDELTSTDRWRYELKSESALPRGWRGRINAEGVSDRNYLEDLTSTSAENSRTNVERDLTFDYYDDVWSLNVNFQDFQTIDPIILPSEEPYLQAPNFSALGEWTDGWLGLDYSLESEAVYFDRDDSVNGLRMHLQPQVSLPFRHGSFYVIPEIGVDLTSYSLDNTAPGANSSPSRSAPIASIDTGAVFDRLAGKSNQWLITLEPRAQYVHIPFRDQSDLPIFDTIMPDFNLVQLYRKNRFIGGDRLGDTDQLSLGLTGRVLSSENGRELLTASVGQTRFFENGKVRLPGAISSSDDSTDYIALASINVWEKWGIDMNYQWDSETRNTEKSAVRLRFRPGDQKAVNFAYRFANQSLEQTDFSFAWPLADQWKVIGRYNYSLRENVALDRFVGLEYESCCWGISVLGRRTVARTTGRSDSAISVQFIFKGFSNLGSNNATNLRRDILNGVRF